MGAGAALDMTGVSLTGLLAIGAAAGFGGYSSSLRLFHIYNKLLIETKDATIVLRPY
jgi:hypothetical protein